MIALILLVVAKLPVKVLAALRMTQHKKWVNSLKSKKVSKFQAHSFASGEYEQWLI